MLVELVLVKDKENLLQEQGMQEAYTSQGYPIQEG